MVMAPQTEQVKPLAPATIQIRSDEDQETQLKTRRGNCNCVKCCGCITAILLILATTCVVLGLTVFHVKDPVIKMNQVKVGRLDLANLNNTNVTLIADASVKNPNAAAFKFNNGTTSVYYHGVMVGEGTTPGGKAKARRTMHMNVSVDIISKKLLNVVTSYPGDLVSGALTMSSNTIIGGKVRILHFFKKHIVVTVNCTMTYNVTAMAIQGDTCKTHLSL